MAATDANGRRRRRGGGEGAPSRSGWRRSGAICVPGVVVAEAASPGGLVAIAGAAAPPRRGVPAAGVAAEARRRRRTGFEPRDDHQLRRQGLGPRRRRPPGRAHDRDAERSAWRRARWRERGALSRAFCAGTRRATRRRVRPRGDRRRKAPLQRRRPPPTHPRGLGGGPDIAARAPAFVVSTTQLGFSPLRRFEARSRREARRNEMALFENRSARARRGDGRDKTAAGVRRAGALIARHGGGRRRATYNKAKRSRRVGRTGGDAPRARKKISWRLRRREDRLAGEPAATASPTRRRRVGAWMARAAVGTVPCPRGRCADSGSAILAAVARPP